jgi:hypothetical protein
MPLPGRGSPFSRLLHAWVGRPRKIWVCGASRSRGRRDASRSRFTPGLLSPPSLHAEFPCDRACLQSIPWQRTRFPGGQPATVHPRPKRQGPGSVIQALRDPQPHGGRRQSRIPVTMATCNASLDTATRKAGLHFSVCRRREFGRLPGRRDESNDSNCNCRKPPARYEASSSAISLPRRSISLVDSPWGCKRAYGLGIRPFRHSQAHTQQVARRTCGRRLILEVPIGSLASPWKNYADVAPRKTVHEGTTPRRHIRAPGRQREFSDGMRHS